MLFNHLGNLGLSSREICGWFEGLVSVGGCQPDHRSQQVAAQHCLVRNRSNGILMGLKAAFSARVDERGVEQTG
jgi:hypothetical protein